MMQTFIEYFFHQISEKDDAQWKKDLDEAKKFLDTKGFY